MNKFKLIFFFNWFRFGKHPESEYSRPLDGFECAHFAENLFVQPHSMVTHKHNQKVVNIEKRLAMHFSVPTLNFDEHFQPKRMRWFFSFRIASHRTQMKIEYNSQDENKFSQFHKFRSLFLWARVRASPQKPRRAKCKKKRKKNKNTTLDHDTRNRLC